MNKRKSKSEAAAQPKERPERQEQQERSLGARFVIGFFKLLLVPVLCLAGLAAGLWIGYVYVGGKSSGDVWEWDTWKHLFDLVFAS